MPTWNFASQLCFTTLMSNKFKACKDSELALTSWWSWGKHPPSCQKPRCPSLWHWDTFSAQRETDWGKGDGERESERLFFVRKMRPFKDLKRCSQGEQLLNACYVSVWSGVCSLWSWFISSLSTSTPPQPTDKWPSITSHHKTCFLKVLYWKPLSPLKYHVISLHLGAIWLSNGS